MCIRSTPSLRTPLKTRPSRNRVYETVSQPVYRVCRYAKRFCFSSCESMSLYAGMPLPPLLICSSTFASFTGLPLCSVLRLNSPLSDGPIFFSSVSTLWQTAHCSNVSLPLAASPFDADWAAEIPTVRDAQTTTQLIDVKVRRFIVQSP